MHSNGDSGPVIAQFRHERRSDAENSLAGERPDAADRDWMEAADLFQPRAVYVPPPVLPPRPPPPPTRDGAASQDSSDPPVQEASVYYLVDDDNQDACGPCERLRADQDRRDEWLDTEYESETEEMVYWSPQSWDEPMEMTRTQTVSLHGCVTERNYSMRRVLLFHVPHPPAPVEVPGMLTEVQAGALVSQRNVQHAEATVLASKIARAAELQHVKDQARILQHDDGWSHVGSVRAIHPTHFDARGGEERLDFYMGRDTRLTL